MARSFNGTTDKIDCGTNALLAPTTGSFTYAGWVKPNSPTGYDAPFGDYPSGIGIFVESSFKIAVYAFGPIYDATGTHTLTNNVWAHLAVTYNTATFAGAGYVDGAIDGSGTGGGAISTGNFYIGFGSGGGAPFHGSIADVGVWNTILTVSEILALAQGARPKTIRRASLQGYWPVDGLQSPEPDLSGNVFNGTVTGTTYATGPPITLFTPRRPMFIPESVAAQQILMGQIWM